MKKESLYYAIGLATNDVKKSRMNMPSGIYISLVGKINNIFTKDENFSGLVYLNQFSRKT